MTNGWLGQCGRAVRGRESDGGLRTLDTHGSVSFFESYG